MTKNWYRWGYGWSNRRKYGALTADEAATADAKLAEFFASDPKLPCD